MHWTYASFPHNAPFRTEMCTFLFWMEHCGEKPLLCLVNWWFKHIIKTLHLWFFDKTRKFSTMWAIRADSRLAPSQWQTELLCNDVSHWLDASLESALVMIYTDSAHMRFHPHEFLDTSTQYQKPLCFRAGAKYQGNSCGLNKSYDQRMAFSAASLTHYKSSPKM